MPLRSREHRCFIGDGCLGQHLLDQHLAFDEIVGPGHFEHRAGHHRWVRAHRAPNGLILASR